MAAFAQSDAVNSYEQAVGRFKAILSERQAQISSHQRLPDLPGQALYRTRNDMISTYKDLTDAFPARIGRPNKFGIPPAYFDAANTPLLDEYRELFKVMQPPPAAAQYSDTPFKDVVELGTAIARAKGLNAADAAVAGRISLGIFFAETNGMQNLGNARSNAYKGSFQTGVSEDANGRKKWLAIKDSIASFAPELIARDAKEEVRVGNLDRRYNHWLAVRDGLMNTHAELFRQIPAIAKALPDPIDQMKVFELVQIIPTPTRAALTSGNLAGYKNLQSGESWDTCATTAFSRLGMWIGPERPRAFAKSSTPCGCSTTSLKAHWRSSTRLGHPGNGRARDAWLSSIRH